jgi:hypothetical protein
VMAKPGFPQSKAIMLRLAKRQPRRAARRATVR